LKKGIRIKDYSHFTSSKT